MRKAFLTGLICTALAYSFAAHASVLRVVGDNNYPPYLFLGPDGNPRGYVVDEWKLWERKTGIKVELTATSWEDAQQRMLHGQADVIEMIFKTPDREPLYDFTAPYAQVTVGIYTDVAITGINDVGALQGFDVGVERGDACVERLHNNGITSVHEFAGYADVIAAADRHEIRIFCMDEYPADYYLYKLGSHHRFSKSFDFYSDDFRRGVHKGDARTLALVTNGMALITAKERAALRRKWMGQPVNFTPYAVFLGYVLLAGTLAGIALIIWIHALRRAVKRRTAALEREQAQWRTLVESNPDSIWLRDAEGIYLACNPQAARYLGKPASEILGRTDAQIFGEGTATEQRQWDLQVLGSRIPMVREELARPDATDAARVIESIRTPVLGSDGVAWGVLGVARDITGRKQAEERLEQAAKVFESTLDGVVITDLQGRIVAVNQAFCSITGYAETEALGCMPAMLDGDLGETGPMHTLWATIGQTGTWQGEIRNVRRSGERYPAWWTISAANDKSGHPTHYVGVFSDLGRIKHFENQLDFLAYHDPLTGLPNRRLLVDRLDHAIAHSSGTRLAVLLIDLDRFKHVNEIFGHPVGDLLLREVAERLPACVSAADTIAHLGGDEFVVVLSGQANTAAVSAAASQILLAMGQPFVLNGQETFVGASIGISVYPYDGDSGVMLLKNADAAVYRAKRDGRNACSFYSAALTQQAQHLLQLGSSLRRALERDEFVLFYQPQVQVPTARIVGVEALIRWQSPGGLVPPGDFIPYAEESGLIEPIGRWVLHAACRQLAQWLADGVPPLRMAVNLSARQLSSPDLVAEVKAALEASQLPPELLELEITESALMLHGGRATEILDALGALGVGLAIDDFGTGYSSLAYLRHFPVKLLKIDQGFMKDIPDDPGATEIASAIVAMAHSLHMQVLAEGVENARQWTFLQEIGCDFAQGWHHGKAMPAAEAETMIRLGIDGPARTGR